MYMYPSLSTRATGLLLVTMFVCIATLKYNIDIYVAEKKAAEYAILAAHEAKVLAEKTVKAINPEHIRCLATNIYHEAGSEPFMGQVAVARVVVNRIKSGFASTPCKVIYQTTTVTDLESTDGIKKICQFSWVCQGKGTPVRNQSYIQAENIAKQVLAENKWRDEIPSNILFFHNNAVDPGWGYKRVMVIGNHVFYSKK